MVEGKQKNKAFGVVERRDAVVSGDVAGEAWRGCWCAADRGGGQGRAPIMTSWDNKRRRGLCYHKLCSYFETSGLAPPAIPNRKGRAAGVYSILAPQVCFRKKAVRGAHTRKGLGFPERKRVEVVRR